MQIKLVQRCCHPLNVGVTLFAVMLPANEMIGSSFSGVAHSVTLKHEHTSAHIILDKPGFSRVYVLWLRTYCFSSC